MNQTENNVIKIVSYFRKLGFFRKYTALNDEDLVKKLVELSQKDTYFGPLNEKSRSDNPTYFDDLLILKYDDSRVWTIEDCTAILGSYAKKNGYMYCEDYKEVLNHLIKISQNVFLPSKIDVAGSSTIKITFLLEQKQIQFRLKGDGEVLNFDLLKEINQLIKDTGYEFAAVMDKYGLTFILFVKKEEKEQIEKDRNWNFYNF